MTGYFRTTGLCVAAILLASATTDQDKDARRPTAEALSFPNDGGDGEVPLPSDDALDCNVGSTSVYFGRGSAEISTESQVSLAAVIDATRRCPFAEVTLSGHSDQSGRASLNDALSQRRADAVKARLQTLAPGSLPIATEAFGESRPQVLGSDEQSFPLNRRVDVDIRGVMPPFPLPAPQPSERFSISHASFGSGTTTLRQVDRRLRLGLARGNYRQPSYLAVPNGFAMILRTERRQPDAKPWANPTERWQLGPTTLLPSDAGLLSRFISAWSKGPANAGEYRTYVFIVTTADIQASAPPPSSAEAQRWLDTGRAGELPNAVKAMPFSPQHQVIALVYDYVRPTVTSPLKLRHPSPYDVPAWANAAH
jgi:outer membrane protein OmpA-like peptidoglycan-associated protein